MRPRRFAIVACVLLAACGGGGTSGLHPSLLATPAPSSSPAAKTTTGGVTLSLVIPARSPSGSAVRKPLYVSASTESIGVAINGGPPVFFNTVPGSQACPNPPAGTPLTCTFSVAAPFGQDTFAVTLYSGQNGTGSALASGTASHVIAAGVNTVALTFDGVIASLAMSLGACTPGTAGSTTVLNLTALDAKGNTIIGPGSYSNAIALFDSDTTGATSLSNGSAGAAGVSVTGPAQTITLGYTGAAFTAATLSADVPDQPAVASVSLPITPANLTCTPMVNAPKTLSVAAGATASFTATETGFTGTLTSAIAAGGSASIAVTPGTTGGGASEQFVVGGLAPTTTPINVTISDGNPAHDATIAITVTPPPSGTTVVCLPTASSGIALSGDSAFSGMLALPGASPQGSCVSASYAEGSGVTTPPGGLSAPGGVPGGATLLYILSVKTLSNVSFGSPVNLTLAPPSLSAYASFGEVVYAPAFTGAPVIPGITYGAWNQNPQPCAVASTVSCGFTTGPIGTAVIPVNTTFGFAIYGAAGTLPALTMAGAITVDASDTVYIASNGSGSASPMGIYRYAFNPAANTFAERAPILQTTFNFPNPPSSAPATVTAPNTPGGMDTDPAGNLYASNYYEILNGSGCYDTPPGSYGSDVIKYGTPGATPSAPALTVAELSCINDVKIGPAPAPGSYDIYVLWIGGVNVYSSAGVQYNAGLRGYIPFGASAVNAAALAVDASGRVYVTDYNNGAVYRYSYNSSTQTWAMDLNLSINGGFAEPGGIVVDAANDIIVSDRLHGIRFYTSTGAQAFPDNTAYAPNGLAFDSTKQYLFGVNHGSPQVEVFKFNGTGWPSSPVATLP